MNLDIRIPIGLMFAVIGVIMVIFGLVSDPKIYERSLGINVNVVWGCVLVVFSAFMLAMAYRAYRKTK
jgi:hypothetical protein